MLSVDFMCAHRNGLNLGSYEKWMIINRFDQQHAGAYTCRPIPPQNVQSPSLSLALGRKQPQATKPESFSYLLVYLFMSCSQACRIFLEKLQNVTAGKISNYIFRFY